MIITELLKILVTKGRASAVNAGILSEQSLCTKLHYAADEALSASRLIHAVWGFSVLFFPL